MFLGITAVKNSLVNSLVLWLIKTCMHQAKGGLSSSPEAVLGRGAHVNFHNSLMIHAPLVGWSACLPGHDGSVCVWEVSTMELKKKMTGHKSFALRCQWTADEQYIITVAVEEVIVW